MNISRHIPATLLVGQAIYLAFVPVSIAHSIILFSLAGLFAFNQFLLSKETPSLSIELSKLQSELEKQLEKQKELHEVRLKAMEDELARVSISTIRTASSSSSKEAAKKSFQF